MNKKSEDTFKIVPDTSVIIDGRISEKIKNKEYLGAEIYIAEAVVSEIEAQANKGLIIGSKELEELKNLRKLADENYIELIFTGVRPNAEQVKRAKSGEIDAMIRKLAVNLNAIFVTGDKVQAQIAEIYGLEVDYIYPPMIEFGPLMIDKFFTKDTMSVHLKHKVFPMAKKGTIKGVRFEKIRNWVCTYKELKEISRELVDRARSDFESFTEMTFNGAQVLQIRDLRVAISISPFSDDFEITAVRPIITASLEDYKLNEELKKRIVSQRGILIVGPPGAGKSTFAAGIATYLNDAGCIVKTMESPRDLQVPKEITQYAPLEGSMENTADLLLLVRPDYTIYDELRKTHDFHIFADMRLAGVGMIGVAHANRPIDAIQRLISRIELGVIPQIVDTVIYINKGEIEAVQVLEFIVKVPAGMVEEDLARPVIIVSNFETKSPEYEIYSYGDQVVIMPVGKEKKKATWKLAETEIQNAIGRYAEGPIEVEIISDNKAIVKVSEFDIARVIGKGGYIIDKIENSLGIRIDVRKIEDLKLRSYTPSIEFTKKHLLLNVPEAASQNVEIYIDSEYIFTATVGRQGDIRIKHKTEIAYLIQEAIENDNRIEVKMI
ncbi:MAG: PINc/VapC family ATPase [Methanosarcinaceae archaeon]|nr:PINc/VapC family ATPase [Methanosarcinaceae archaeon]